MAGDRPTSDVGGGLYREPLLYDVVNTPGTAAEVDAFERIARRHLGPGPRRWLEPACGTGRYLRVLRGRGHEVAGYDPLPEMLAYARGRLARWPHGWSLGEAGFVDPVPVRGRFELAICPVNSLRHLPDDEAVIAHLAQIKRALAPGGLYVVGLDLHRPAAMIDEDVWVGRRGPLTVQQVVQYLPPDDDRREQVIMQMMVTRPRGREHHGWFYHLRTYTAAQWSEVIAQAGWRRLEICDGTGRTCAGTIPLPYQLDVLQPTD
jgi:SAM-dependent methyltransferase